MSLIGRSVSSVRMHTSTHVTGIGNLGPNLSKANDPTGVRGKIQMEVVAEGILISSGKHQAVIAHGNIISFELEPAKTALSDGTNNNKGSDSRK